MLGYAFARIRESARTERAHAQEKRASKARAHHHWPPARAHRSLVIPYPGV